MIQMSIEKPSDQIIILSLHNDLSARIQFALKECEESIEWYRQHGGFAYVASKTIDVVSLALGGLIPILILGFDSHGTHLIAATFGAVSTILTAISKTMKFESDWRRFCVTEQELSWEKYQYMTKTGTYAKHADPEESLRFFVGKVTRIKRDENDKWKVAVDSDSAGDEGKKWSKLNHGHHSSA